MASQKCGSTLEVPHHYLQSPLLLPNVHLHVTGIQTSAVRHCIPPTYQFYFHAHTKEIHMCICASLYDSVTKTAKWIFEECGRTSGTTAVAALLMCLSWLDPTSLWPLTYFKWSSAVFWFHQTWGRTLYSNHVMRTFLIFVLQERPCDCIQKIYLVWQ